MKSGDTDSRRGILKSGDTEDTVNKCGILKFEDTDSKRAIAIRNAYAI